MATLSVLGSLMSQLGSTPVPQYDPQQVALMQQRLQSGRIDQQTSLLALQEQQRQQEAEARVRQAVQQDPRLLFGDSVLGTLDQPGPGAPPGAITQQAFGPGGVSGPAQTIPALMQPNANLGMPQSTLGALTPPMSPQARLLALARENPDAARLLQQQIQGQQDAALKRQEQQLTMGTKVMEYLGRGAQGVTDQASLDAFRQEVARVHPQAAAQLPQFYSKEAMAPFMAKALDVKEALTLQVQDLQAQAAVIKARREGRSVDVDNQLRAMGVAPGQETAQQMKEALGAIQQGKVDVSAAQGAQGAQTRALGETAQKRLEAFDKAGYTAQQTHAVLDQMEALIHSEAGVYGNSPEGVMRMKAYESGLAPNDQRARNTAQLRNLASNLQLAHGSLGTGVSEYDARVYAKAAGDMQNAQNVDQMKQYITQMRPALQQAMTSANEARRSFKETGDLPEFRRQGTTGTPRATTASNGTVKLEVLADYAAKHQIPIGQAIRQAYDKGLEIQ